jgi:hypothetical protein
MAELMKYYDTPIPYIVIDDFFTPDELELVWQELDFLTHKNKLKPAHSTASATDIAGRVIKKNYALFLDQAYPVREISNILPLMNKVWDKKFTEWAEQQNFVFQYINKSNQSGVLLNYYEDGHYYMPHTDAATLTVLVTLYKEPINFTGGNLYLGKEKTEVPLTNNQMIVFPSVALHSVSTVKFNKNEADFSGLGRYSISQFITYGLG